MSLHDIKKYGAICDPNEVINDDLYADRHALNSYVAMLLLERNVLSAAARDGVLVDVTTLVIETDESRFFENIVELRATARGVQYPVTRPGRVGVEIPS